jgi:hypothetical protein
MKINMTTRSHSCKIGSLSSSLRSLRCLLLEASVGALSLLFLLAAVQKACAQTASYPATILSNNPVAYYQLQELPGAATAVDSSSNHLDATYEYDTNNLTPELGLPGIDTNSIAFLGELPGGYGFIDIPFNNLLAPVAADGSNGAPFSIECWAQAASDNVNIGGTYQSLIGMFGIYGSGEYANASGWLIGQTPGPNSEWLFNMKNAGFEQGPNPVTPLKWTHLVGTFDGSNQCFYIDGALAVSNSGFATSYLPDDGSDGVIGGVANAGFPPYSPWLGGVDQVAFYTNALTPAQISNDYVVGLSAFSQRAFPPAILEEPGDQTNFSGTEASFAVVAIGSAPLSYQWSRQGTGEIPGATNATYSFLCQYPSDNNAIFSVTVSNADGGLTSETATLQVETNLVVEGNPFSITRNVGSHAAFRLAIVGALPITYQWSESTNGGSTFTPLPGQTSDTLWLTNVQLTQSGNEYEASAVNPFTNYSSAAVLTVVPRTEFVPLTGYAAIVAADNPVAYWQLNEGSNASNAVDCVGTFDGYYDNTNGPIVFGITGGVPNDTNTAVDLQDPQSVVPGLGGIINVPYALELNPFGPWSVEAWVRPDSVDGLDRVPISFWENTNYDNSDLGWVIDQNGSIPSYWTLILGTGGPSQFYGSESIDVFSTPGAWNHLVLTDDGSNILLYVNGALGLTTTVAASGYMPQGINGDVTVGGTNEIIGQRSDFENFGGNAGTEDVAFYNYALSPAQIQAHYLNRANPLLNLSQTNGTIVLTWSTGNLLGTTNLSQPFELVTGATSPYTVPASNSSQFFYVVAVPK